MKFDKLVYFSLLFIFFVIPILFYPMIYDAFMLPKFTVLLVITTWLFFIWLIKIIRECSITIKLDNLFLPIILFLVIAILSFIFSYHRLTSKNELYLIICIIIIYFLITNFIPSDKLKNLLVAFFISSIFVAIYSILQHLGIDFVKWELHDPKIRSTSTLGNPNFVSAYLSLITPVALFLLINAGARYKIFYLIALSIIFVGMIFTYSRGGWVSFILGLVVFLFLTRKSLNLLNITYITIFLMFIGIFSVILVKREKVVIDKREVDVFERIKSISDVEYPSIKIRRYLFHDSLYMIRARIIHGWGLDTFTVVFPKFRSKELLPLAGRYNLPEHAHNEYLQVAATAGLVGLFSFLWIIIITLRNYIRNYDNGLSACLFTCFLIFLFQSIFYFKLISTYLLFFVTIAASNVINRRYVTKKVDFQLLKITRVLLIISFLTLPLLLSVRFISQLIADYYYKLGRDYAISEMFDVAETHFLRAHTLAPQEKKYLHSFGLLYEYVYKVLSAKTGDKLEKQKKEILNKGIEKYKQALKLYPYDAFLYQGLAKLYTSYAIDFDKKKLKLAYEAYEKAIELDKNNCIFYNDIGLVYLYDNKKEEALKNFNKAIELDKTYPLPYSNLGMVYYTNGDTKSAIKYLEKAIELNKEFKEAIIRLAIIYREIGEDKKAIYYMKKAKEITKEDTTIDAILKEWQKNKK